MVYVSKYLYKDMGGWTGCKPTDFIIHDQRQKHNSCDIRVLANFHAIDNDSFTCQHRYHKEWTGALILPINSSDWTTMAEPDGLISIVKLVITLQTGPSLAVCILSLAFQG